jgi:glycosyltransferase involved in cell wall biosynthesis
MEKLVTKIEVPANTMKASTEPPSPTAKGSGSVNRAFSADEYSVGNLDVDGRGVRIDRSATSESHLVIIPSFNTGRLLAATVAAALEYWRPVWVVIDGSTDDSAAAVDAIAQTDPALRVYRLPSNQGKGEAVRFGLTAAEASGFTHALVMDADGQHRAESISAFMAMSAASPEAVIMGRPVFGADAPWIRVVSRRLCNACATLVTLRRVGDTLFGFRVYPIAKLLSVMRASHGMRRFDFDPEAVIRLAWDRTPFIHLPTRVRYLSRADGGVSHFNYVLDNFLLIGMYLRLSRGAVMQLWRVALAWPQGRRALGPRRNY